jgi:hypothetical protein
MFYSHNASSLYSLPLRGARKDEQESFGKRGDLAMMVFRGWNQGKVGLMYLLLEKQKYFA